MGRRKKNQQSSDINQQSTQPDEPASENELKPKSEVLSEAEAKTDAVIFSDLRDLSKTERAEIAKFVCDQINTTTKSDSWSKHLQKIDYCWDAYEQKTSSRTLPYFGAPNVRVDFDASIVDGYVSRMLSSNFDTDPLVHIEGTGAEDLDKAPKIELFMQWYNQRKLNLYDMADTGFLRKAVEGHHVSKLVWDLDVERVKRVKKAAIFAKGKQTRLVMGSVEELAQASAEGFEPTGDIKHILVDEDEVRHDGPKLVTIPGQDYIFPIQATSMDQKPRWESHQMWMFRDDILKKIAHKTYFSDCWAPIKKSGPYKYNVEVKAEDQQDQGGDADTGQYRMIQWQGRYRRKSDPYERMYLFTVHLDSQTLVRAQYHPYDHGNSIFHHNRLFTNRGFWGFGVPWAVRHMSWVCSEMVNQMVENGFLANSLNYKYKKLRFDPSKETFLPGKGIGLENLDDLQELNIGGRRVVLDLALLRSLREMAETRVGFGKLQSGQPDPRQRTARGVMALLQQGALTFDRTVKADQNWLEGVVEQEVQLFQQFLPQDGVRFKNVRQSVERLMNKEITADEMFPLMLPNEIAGQYDFTAMGSSHAATRELDLQLNLFLYNTLKDNLVVKSDPEAFYKLTKGVVDATRKKTSILPSMEHFVGKVAQQTQGAQQPDQRQQVMARAQQMLAEKGATPEETQKVMAALQARLAAQMPQGGEGMGGGSINADEGVAGQMGGGTGETGGME